MMIEKKIQELGITLPSSSPPGAMYVPVKQLGHALFISGQIPIRDGRPLYTGKVGDAVTQAQAEECARQCVVNMLAACKDYLGDLDKVKNIIKVQAFVNSKTGFLKQHLVANAASQLLFDVFGEIGRHARTAVGTNQLPMDVPVEIEAILEL